MKIIHSLLLLSGSALLAFAALPCASAQVTPPVEGAFQGGLLGQNYSGIELGYVRHHQGPPRVMRRYGFVASRPIPDGRDLDGIFRYNYTRGSTLGADGQQHDFAIGLAGYQAHGPVKPFLEGDIGWAWARAVGTRRNSFLYEVRTGVEMMLSSHVSLTPFVSYGESRQFHQRGWDFGLKAAFRLNAGWSTTLAVDIDEGRNVETGFGVQRRY